MHGYTIASKWMWAAGVITVLVLLLRSSISKCRFLPFWRRLYAKLALANQSQFPINLAHFARSMETGFIHTVPLKPRLQGGGLCCTAGRAGAQADPWGRHTWVSLSCVTSYYMILGTCTNSLCLFFYVFEVGIVISTSEGSCGENLTKYLLHTKH